MGKRAAIILPDELTYIRRVNMPAMTVELLKVNLPYEFHDYITQEKDKYFYDYALLDMEEDGTPKNMDLLAAAVKKSVISDYRQMFAKAGMKLAVAVPATIAYGNLIHSYENMQENSIGKDYGILDLGNNEIRLHIFTKGKYDVTRTMEIGMESLDQAIGEKYSVDIHIARMYKHKNHENVWELEECRNIYGRMGVEVRRVLNFYNFNNPDNALDTIYYCGGGSAVTPLLDVIRENVEIELKGIETLFPSQFALDAEMIQMGAEAICITME